MGRETVIDIKEVTADAVSDRQKGSCYANSLNMVAELSCASIAFPLIATGVYGFQKDEALQIAFSPSNKFDLIITYFITNKVYDIYEINAALFKYGQPILGE